MGDKSPRSKERKKQQDISQKKDVKAAAAAKAALPVLKGLKAH